MKKLLLIILLLPSFAYSQPNGVFESIRVNNIHVLDTLFIEDNVSTPIFSVGNDGIVHIQDTSEFLLLAGISQLDNKNTEVEIGDNLLKAIAIFSVSMLCIVGIIGLVKYK